MKQPNPNIDRTKAGWLTLIGGRYIVDCGSCGTALPLDATLKPHARKKAREAGWEFGTGPNGEPYRWRCPDCASKAKANE